MCSQESSRRPPGPTARSERAWPSPRGPRLLRSAGEVRGPGRSLGRMTRYISMVTRYGSKRGGNYGSMGAVDFGTRGGRDAGRRHELRRYTEMSIDSSMGAEIMSMPTDATSGCRSASATSEVHLMRIGSRR